QQSGRIGQFRLTPKLLSNRARGFTCRSAPDRIVPASLASRRFLMASSEQFSGRHPARWKRQICRLLRDLIKLLARTLDLITSSKPVAGANTETTASTHLEWHDWRAVPIVRRHRRGAADHHVQTRESRWTFFSTPYMEEYLDVASRSPIWASAWCCYVVSRFARTSAPQPESDKADKGHQRDFSIFNSLWFTLSAFMQQGGDISPSYTGQPRRLPHRGAKSSTPSSRTRPAKQNQIKYGVVLNAGGSSKEVSS
uniref:PBPe domain-containing protein n=1 Tax=Macrostomum lignano TaxID=282301 RepID=A0A1I8FNG7_9PLAT